MVAMVFAIAAPAGNPKASVAAPPTPTPTPMAGTIVGGPVGDPIPPSIGFAGEFLNSGANHCTESKSKLTPLTSRRILLEWYSLSRGLYSSERSEREITRFLLRYQS